RYEAAVVIVIVLLAKLADLGTPIMAVGHRVVHGGRQYYQPVKIASDVVDYLKSLIPFAPLHQPYNVAAIETILKQHPEIEQVACFDTAFHHTQAPLAVQFGIPRSLTYEGVRRYGFHGLSYEYIISKVKTTFPEKYRQRIIVAHLGNGASLCAIKDGISIASTMGFSTLEGLLMGTRCGSIDPGVLLYLMQFKKLDAAAIEKILYKESGLLGVSGISNNMQVLLDNHSKEAKEAVELFIYRIKREIGSLAAALEGLDLLIFTGGIGENASTIREAVSDSLDWLGHPAVMVIPTDEEWVIANHTLNLLKL
ncbi:MAG TPA: acetate/propionate family kinase, partial [Candidatus Berkiella sp.]|nr:acetate/propionate family kinase [Candidatus Berkiella sp.]